MQDDQAVDKHEALNRAALRDSKLEEANIRKLNAEADLLEAQARDTRAQAEHRETVVESMKVVNSLQKLQVQAEINKLSNAAPAVN